MTGAFTEVFSKADHGVPTVEALIGRELAEWHNSSPSQCKEEAACPSRQWLDKIARFPRIERASTKRGADCHVEAEVYLVKGTAPGPIIAAGLHRLPAPPVNPAFVEAFAAIRDPELPVLVVLKIDLVEPRGLLVDYPRITDHKTTSSFRYARSPDELRHDFQALIYCVGAAPAFYGVDTSTGEVYENHRGEVYPIFDLDLSDEALGDGLAFRHVYYRTDRRLNPDSRESEVYLSAAELRAGWIEKVRPSVMRQYDLSKLRDVRDAPYDLSHCSDYGGCQFKTLCAGLGRKTLGAASFFFAPDPTSKGDQSVNLLQNLAKNKAAQANGASSSSNPLLSAMKARPETAGDPPVDLLEGEAKQPDLLRDPDAEPTVNPPDGVAHGADYTEPAPPVKKGEAVVPADLEVPHAGERLKGLKKAPLLELYPELRRLVGEAGLGRIWSRLTKIPKGVVAEAKKNTRPEIRDDCELLLEILAGKHAESAPPASEDPPADEGVAEAVEEHTEPENLEERPLDEAERDPEVRPSDRLRRLHALDEHLMRAATEAGTALHGALGAPLRILFVDCAPRRPAEAVFLHDLLRPLQIAAAKELSVVSYRVPQYKRGEDNVVARLEVGIEDGSIKLPPVLVAETSLPNTKIALEALLPHYDLVVERIGW